MKNLLTLVLLVFTSGYLFGQLATDDRLTITQNSAPYIGVYAFGYQELLPANGFPQFQLNNYGGLPGAAAATADNSILGLFAFSGHNGAAKKTVGIIRVKTMDNFAANLSSRMDFLLGPNREQRMTILGDSGNVGIGTENPTNRLDVMKDGHATVGITADNGTNTSTASLVLKTNTDINDELFIKKYGSGEGGTFNNGIPLANMSVVTAGAAAGPLYTGTIGDHPVYLASGNEVAVFLDTDQDVGINTQNPNAQMHVVESEGNNSYTIYGESTFSGNSDKYGVRGRSINNPGYGYGGYFEGGYRGLYGTASSTSYTGIGIGIQGYASGTAGQRRGVNGQAYNPGGTTAYGIYGVASGAAANYGVYGTVSGSGSNWAGYFNGNAYVDDTLVVNDRIHINSDESKNARLVVMDASSTDAVYVRNPGTSATAVGGYGIEVDAGYRGIDVDMNDANLNGSHYGYYISNITEGADLTGNQYGMYAYTSGNRVANGGNFSLYAQEGGTSGSGTNWAAYFAGDVRVTGTLDNASDARLKKDIEDMDDALGIIRQLQPKTYEFRTDEFPHMALDARPQLGFIAQDMEKVLPQLVRTAMHPEFVNDKGEESDIPNAPAVDVKSINYIGIIPVLTQGIKELAGEMEQKDEAIEELTTKLALLENQLAKIEHVDELLSQISAVEDKLANLDAMTIRMEQLEKDLQSCCLSSNAVPGMDGSTGTNIELNGSENEAQLGQNAPNPFNTQTAINYYIPASATKAQLTITDMKGAILKSVNLETAGFGTVNIRAGELAAGTYAYTLAVDGKRVETKQMVLVK